MSKIVVKGLIHREKGRRDEKKRQIISDPSWHDCGQSVEHIKDVNAGVAAAGRSRDSCVFDGAARITVT